MSYKDRTCEYKDKTMETIKTGPFTKVLIQLTTIIEDDNPCGKLLSFRKFRRVRGSHADWYPLRDSGSGIAIDIKYGRILLEALQKISEKEFGFKIEIVEIPSDEKTNEE